MKIRTMWTIRTIVSEDMIHTQHLLPVPIL